MVEEMRVAIAGNGDGLGRDGSTKKTCPAAVQETQRGEARISLEREGGSFKHSLI